MYKYKDIYTCILRNTCLYLIYYIMYVYIYIENTCLLYVCNYIYIYIIYYTFSYTICKDYFQSTLYSLIAHCSSLRDAPLLDGHVVTATNKLCQRSVLCF